PHQHRLSRAYAAYRREVAGLVSIGHRSHREDDSIERFLREFLVDVKRWSDNIGHLIACLLLEFSGDGLRRDLRRSSRYTAPFGSGSAIIGCVKPALREFREVLNG